MSGLPLASLIWTLSLLLQGYVVWLTVVELRSPYGFRRWYWKWGLMAAATSLMLVRRLYHVLWLHVDLPFLTLNRALLETYVPFSITVLLALALRQARAIYSPIAPLAPAKPAIIFIDGASTILAWNVQATMLFGWTAAEAVGQNLATLIIPEALQQTHLDGVARWLALPPERRIFDAQYLTRARHKAGYEFRVEVVITYLEQQDGRVQFHGSVRKLIPV